MPLPDDSGERATGVSYSSSVECYCPCCCWRSAAIPARFGMVGAAAEEEEAPAERAHSEEKRKSRSRSSLERLTIGLDLFGGVGPEDEDEQ